MKERRYLTFMLKADPMLAIQPEDLNFDVCLHCNPYMILVFIDRRRRGEK